MTIVLVIILVLAVCNSVLIERVYQTLPLIELRRRARAGHDKHAAALYKMMAYGPSLQLLLWLKGTVCAAILIIWAARGSWWLAIITAVLASLAFLAARGQNAAGWQVRYASRVAPIGAKWLSWLQPVVGGIADKLVGRGQQHTGLYEKEDLLDLLKRQAHQPDSRLSEAQLKAVRGALSFGDKSVGDVMVPRAKVKWLLAGETVGPMIMDELHKTGQTRFAVVKQISKPAHPEVIGSLYLQDLLEHLQDGGHVRDLMHPGASFINETQKLSEALPEFIKSGNYLLVVNNNFEETVGTITLEQVLGQIFGHQPPAEQPPQKEHSQPPESKVE